MEQNWQKAIDFVIGSKEIGNDGQEGYKSDNPSDPGKRTIFGIASAYWPQVVQELWDLPKEDARSKAADFYHDNYWVPVGCPQLWNGLDIAVFDTAVNDGPGEAKRLLSALDATQDWRDYLFFRIHYYTTLWRVEGRFEQDWINRVVDLWRLLKK